MKNKLPALFIGHGNPMNAISDNAFTQTLVNLGKNLPKPKAILCISAHWMTEGTWITHMPHPKTIHDFYGFPQELFDVQYSAPGAPEIAEKIKESIPDAKINLDDEMWGLDHGTWSVLCHMYPEANIPVLQLSLYLSQPASFHYELGKKLSILREEGILIVGSGNLVHNLRMIKWGDTPPHKWASDFDQWLKEKIQARDDLALIHDVLKTEDGKLSVPTWEHYYPFLYVLGAARESDQLKLEYEEIQNASISMLSVSYS